MPGEERPKVKKLTKVIILHCGKHLKDVVKPISRTAEEQLHLERVSYKRNPPSLDSLNEEIKGLGDGERGIFIITPQLLQLLGSGSTELVNNLKDGLLSASGGLPLFVCVKHDVTDEEIRKVFPTLQRVLSFNVDSISTLCNDAYKLWFGNETYVDKNGYHCIMEETQPINCVHIIHAGENKKFLHDLNDAIENVANPECNCEYRRFYRDESKVADIIVEDIDKFVASCGKKQNKCILIVSDSLIDVLTKSPGKKEEEVKRPILFDYTTHIPNFVLLVMTEKNSIFAHSSFWPIIVRYEGDNGSDLENVAQQAVKIWLKPLRTPEESFYSSGENLSEARKQIQQSCQISDSEKMVPSDYASGFHNKKARMPCDGQLVCGEKSLVESPESIQQNQVADEMTKCLQNSHGEEYRPEIIQIQNKSEHQKPREYIQSDNPDDLKSNPPQLYQPSDPHAKGRVALNHLQDSVSLNKLPGREGVISMKTDVRNSDHNNIDVSNESNNVSSHYPEPVTHSGDARTLHSHPEKFTAPSANTGKPIVGSPHVIAPTPAGQGFVASVEQKSQGYQSTPDIGGIMTEPNSISADVDESTKHAKDDMDMRSVSAAEISINRFMSLQDPHTPASLPHSGPNSLPAGQIGQPTRNSGTSTSTNKEAFGCNKGMSTTTSGDSSVYKEDLSVKEDIHLVRGMPQNCLIKLRDRLDLPIPCVHDWRNLAGHYGVPNSAIHVWSGKMPQISASGHLFAWLSSEKPDLTIATLKKDLEMFRRRDAVKILENNGY